jgi:two-component system, chemotaxis family, protein-glutamate methylesterase/glutaminase
MATNAAARIVVIGASAGGLTAMKQLCAALSPNFVGSILFVQHMFRSNSYLPDILSRCGPITATYVTHDLAIQPGNIYVAPPDYHVLLQRDRFQLWHGPRESMQRPSINTTFRSAASVFGETAIGVILSGLLDDGSMGLWYIKRRGGIAIVQSPEDARYPSMPENALRHVNVDYRLPAADIGVLLSSLTAVELPVCDSEHQEEIMESDHPLAATCPDCHGPMLERTVEEMREYRCIVGHSFTPMQILLAHHQSEEKALWAAKAELEESVILLDKVRDELSPSQRAEIEAYIAQKAEYAKGIATFLERLGPFPPPPESKIR